MRVCHRVFAPKLRSVAEQMFLAMHVPQRIAEVVAEILVDSDLCGHDSHGIQLLPLTLRQIEEGEIRPAVKPVVIHESAAVLQVDVGHGLAFYAAKTTMDRLVEKAVESGICCGTLVNYGNTGRLGHFVELAVHQGCIALITNGRGGGGRVVPFGGREGVMGTNPIAAGVPTGRFFKH